MISVTPYASSADRESVLGRTEADERQARDTSGQ
jgi:hypothetical protein